LTIFRRQSNPHLQDFVRKNLGGNFRKLESLFVKRLLNIMKGLNTSYIGETSIWTDEVSCFR